MLLFACAVAMFLPTLNANKSLKFCKSASSHSETHLFTYPEFIIILMMFASIIHVWESMLQQCNTETQTEIPVPLLLWEVDWNFETQPCGCHVLTTATQVPHGLFKVMEITWNICIQSAWKPYCFLNSIDVCHRFPNSLASVLAFFGFLDCQWNNLIC